MQLPLISLKDIIKTAILGLTITILIVLNHLNNKQTIIIFCNVGQGDAAYIRIKNKIDVVIDAGPDSSILNCLGKHMPFWDKNIEIAILSHHDIDHYGGFKYLIERYQINNFLTIDYRFDTKNYKELVKKIKNRKTNLFFALEGSQFTIFNTVFRFYWPPNNLKSYDSNDYSLIFIFQEEDFRLLFTGDSSSLVMNKLLNQPLNNIDILKIPHHGSKNGLTYKFLTLADPRVGVISVGKNNSYGHPSKEVLDMLKAKNILIKRTDIDGDIKFSLEEFP